MGSKQSSLAKSASTDQNQLEEITELEVKLNGERGLISTNNQDVEGIETFDDTFDKVSSDEESSVGSDTDEDSEEDSDDEEEDEDFAERLRILDDAKKLKQLAVAFLHPELPVKVDMTAYARCYFGRPSAPEQETFEEAEYRHQVLVDATALRKLAIDYAHPELPVVSNDPTATARCYFDRPSAPEQETFEEAEYRHQVLADAAALKKLAIDYAHPEIGVVTTDPTAMARCYFDRPSAPHDQSKIVSTAPTQSPCTKVTTFIATKSIPKKSSSFNPSAPIIKTLESTKQQKSSDIGRSLSSVQLFGLEGEGDASY